MAQIFIPPPRSATGPAIAKAIINQSCVCILISEITPRLCNIRLFGFYGNAQNRGYGFRGFNSGCHTGIGSRFAGNNGFGIGRAAGISASAAIGSGQILVNSNNLGINIYIEYL